MAQRTQFYGGLIYYGIPSSALAKCSCIIADTLEEYGHSVDQFSARSSDVIALACDQYRLTLRMGDQPEASDGKRRNPGRQRVEISMQPNFPKHCDTELSEMLMAVFLYRLVPELAAEHVEWMDPSATLTREQFLSVFTNIESLQPEPQTNTQTFTQDRFAPIEETAAELEIHYTEILPSPRLLPAPISKIAPYQRFTAWAGGLMRNNEHHIVSLVPPLTVCAAVVKNSGAL